jgi:hypothetical protein
MSTFHYHSGEPERAPDIRPQPKPIFDPGTAAKPAQNITQIITEEPEVERKVPLYPKVQP